MDEKDLRDYYENRMDTASISFEEFYDNAKNSVYLQEFVYNRLDNPELSLEDWRQARFGDVKKKRHITKRFRGWYFTFRGFRIGFWRD